MISLPRRSFSRSWVNVPVVLHRVTRHLIAMLNIAIHAIILSGLAFVSTGQRAQHRQIAPSAIVWPTNELGVLAFFGVPNASCWIMSCSTVIPKILHDYFGKERSWTGRRSPPLIPCTPCPSQQRCHADVNPTFPRVKRFGVPNVL